MYDTKHCKTTERTVDAVLSVHQGDDVSVVVSLLLWLMRKLAIGTIEGKASSSGAGKEDTKLLLLLLIVGDCVCA
jgi:hypothetical protein